MNLSGSVKLVSQLLDLPIIDSEERWCGIVDDVAIDGKPGSGMRVKALLVGPGAYEGRLPPLIYWLVRKIAGERMVEVPADKILEIGAVVKLGCRAEELRLGIAEDNARTWIPRMGAM